VKNSRQYAAFRIKSHLPQHEHGFSLYDALVTLTVVSTVTTIAIPSFQQLNYNQRLTGAVNTMVTALHLTRSETIKHRERAVLCPSSDGHTCLGRGAGDTRWEDGYLLYIDRNGNREFDADDLAVRVFEATKGLRIRSSAYRDHVTYQPNGLASGTNLSFSFCDERGRGAPRAVIVSNSGRPRVSTRDADGGAINCPATP